MKQIEAAKKLLKDNGYFIDNLWTVQDVQGKFNCSEKEAQAVLERALTNEATMEQIWLSIDTFGEMDGLPPTIRDKNGDILNIGDSVDVDPPKEGSGDAHNFDFNGTITSFDYENGYVNVEDMEENTFCIDTDQLEKS